MASAATAGQLVFDESGQPFIVIREQEKQKRLTGTEALKVLMFIVFTNYWPHGFLSKTKISKSGHM